MRRLFGPKMLEEIGDWNKLHKREFRDFYCSQNNILVNKSRKMKQAVHVGHVGEKRDAYRFFARKETTWKT